MNLKYGTDPEFFSSINLGEKEYVVSPSLLEKDSGLPFLEQDEDEKHPIYIHDSDFSWMMDGVAWELTVKSPKNNYKEIYDVINNSLNVLGEFLKNYKWNGRNLNLYKKPVINIDPSWYIPFLNLRKIYQGFIFGCDPDQDALDQDYLCKTLDVSKHLFRYGGGHIHISGLGEFRNSPRPAIHLLACTVGNFCIANSPYPELEKMRAETYGKAGRYREQEYKNGDFGIEYRTPSNSWCSYSLEKMEELFDWIQIGCKFLVDEKVSILDKYLDVSISNIKNCDQDSANQVLVDIKKEL